MLAISPGRAVGSLDTCFLATVFLPCKGGWIRPDCGGEQSPCCPLGNAGCAGYPGLGMGCLSASPGACSTSASSEGPRVWALWLLFPRGAHFQDVGEQGWVLLDLGAEDSGELHFLLFCEGPRNGPTKPEKFLEGEQDRNRGDWVAGKRGGLTPRPPLASWSLTCTGLWTLR